MLDRFRLDVLSLIATIFFVSYTAWWLALQFIFTSDKFQLDLFTVTYGFIAVWGGLWGIEIARSWGGFKSAMGKVILFFSFGLLAQELGQLIYTYYIYVLGVEVPYPSLGDIGYFGSIPLYIIGTIYLAKVAGVRISMRSVLSKFQALVIPIFILGGAYLVFLQNYTFDWSLPLTIFLDFGYPLGQAIYISIALLTYFLSRSLLGGVMKNKILLILFALLVQFIADFTFLYQASRGEWAISGINDFIYLAAYFMMAIGILQLKSVVKKLQE